MDNSLNVQKGFLWICKTIETCNSLLHLETTERLVENFKRKVNDAEISESIEWMFRIKANQMNYYKWKHFRNNMLENEYVN